MGTQALVLERKIIGVLIRAAREKAHRTVKQVAQQLGVTSARVLQYEVGAREISLPELELLAAYVRMPIAYFLSGETRIEEQAIPFPAPQVLRTRRAIVGAKLKQARLAAGKSARECAAAIGRAPSAMTRYERGVADIPITELELLARTVQVNLDYFVQDGAPRVKSAVPDPEAWTRLPQELRTFILDPSSLPYLRMALKLRDLPADKLKELGEILLVMR